LKGTNAMALIMVVWNVMLCSCVDTYHCLEGTQLPPSDLKVEATVPPWHWYQSMKVRCIIPLTTVIFIRLGTTSNGSPLLTKLRNYMLYGTYKKYYCLHNSPLPEKTLRWLDSFHIFTFPALYCLFHPTKGAHICTLLWHCWLPILCNYIHII